MTNNNYLFKGRLINGHESFEWIKSSLLIANQELKLISAFMKSSILRELSKITERKISILARWDLCDLTAGVSDLECYEIAKEQGWDFYIDFNLHAKLYLIPPSGILVGSANATNAGLGLSKNSNNEACAVVDISDENLYFINNLFNQSTKVDDHLYEQLKDAYEKIDIKKQSNPIWPKDLINKILTKVDSKTKFFINELFQSDGQEILVKNHVSQDESIIDLSLLSINPMNIEKNFAITKFLFSKEFLWLKSILIENNNTASFGFLSNKLHDALLEDPKPYRSDVKKLLSNLYSWIKLIGEKETKIKYERPNHSEILTLINN